MCKGGVMDLKKERVWEIDLLRGIALILMIYFHIIYDMDELFSYNVSYESSINWYIGKASGTLFIFVSGISSYLSGNNFKRALKILGIALIITIATHLFNSDLGIKFGILHFLGTSILLSIGLRKINSIVLVLLGTLLIFLGPAVARATVEHNWFFPLGFSTGNFISSDYYPLIPWFGVFLYGLAAGRIFYQEKKSLFSYIIKDNILSYAGRKTLLIYLIHQPAIMITLYLIGQMR